MKQIKIYLMLICLVMGLLAAPLAAREIYVSDVTKITMRTGPGVGHKIVAMLSSGTRLDILEYQRDWSQVRTQEGRIGWVLSRFLSEEIPKTRLVQELKETNQALEEALEAARDKVGRLEEKNQALEDIEKKYRQLENASADFLRLDAKYQALVKQSKSQKEKIDTLERSLNNEEKLWFLSGAGVFIVGLIIGLSTRKKKRSSLLS